MEMDRIVLKIAENEGTTAYELAKQMGKRYQALFYHIQKLFKRGLIDKRETSGKTHYPPKALYLTELGRKYVEYLRLRDD